MSYETKDGMVGGYPQSAQPVVSSSTTTTTTHGDYSAAAERTKSVARVLGVFALIALVLALVAFGMNVAVVGQGIEVYNTLGTKLNYYGGLWYGLLNAVLCIFSLVFCFKAISNSGTNPNFIHTDGCIRTSGALLSTFFGISAAIGIGAMATAAITTVLLQISDLSTCRATADGSGCVCFNAFVIQGATCAYSTGTMFQIYRGITIICAFLVVLDIVIASLFCGALCCCAIQSPQYGQVGSQQQTVVVTSGQQAYGQPMQPVTTYAQ